ncbi:MAG: hypothetical protein RBT70_04130 [Alphaproteobacteria bacterium]|jgi:hypothetical protein|nr:hypothetical protein [Alphaproteobacteria bacterium]
MQHVFFALVLSFVAACIANIFFSLSYAYAPTIALGYCVIMLITLRASYSAVAKDILSKTPHLFDRDEQAFLTETSRIMISAYHTKKKNIEPSRFQSFTMALAVLAVIAALWCGKYVLAVNGVVQLLYIANSFGFGSENEEHNRNLALMLFKRSDKTSDVTRDIFATSIFTSVQAKLCALAEQEAGIKSV